MSPKCKINKIKDFTSFGKSENIATAFCDEKARFIEATVIGQKDMDQTGEPRP